MVDQALSGLWEECRRETISITHQRNVKHETEPSPDLPEIKRDGTTSGWSNDDYKCFIDYYKAFDFAAFCRIQKRYSPKTAHNTFFLILYEMGLEDKDVRRIMGVTQEAIRSTRYRIQQGDKRKKK